MFSGGVLQGRVAVVTPHQRDQVLAVHLKGSFNCRQAIAGEMMERKGGWIINTVSTAGIAGPIGQINYGRLVGVDGGLSIH